MLKFLAETAIEEVLVRSLKKVGEWITKDMVINMNSFDKIEQEIEKIEKAIDHADAQFDTRFEFVKKQPAEEYDAKLQTFGRMHIFEKLANTNGKGIGKVIQTLDAQANKLIKIIDTRIKGAEKELAEKKKRADKSKAVSGKDSEFPKAAQASVKTMQNWVLDVKTMKKALIAQIKRLKTRADAIGRKMMKLIDKINNAKRVLEKLRVEVLAAEAQQAPTHGAVPLTR
ncbi:MAG: hypothetical protein AAF183_02955 [Pseudomonadota bacterium]